jgi:DNA-binding SARP family transcriptional activator
MTPESPLLEPADREAEAAGQLCLLGRWALRRGEVSLDVPVGGQRVLAYLALRGPGSRAIVAGTLWPDVREDRATGNLRSALWRLNHHWPGLVVHHGRDLRLHPSVALDLDLLVSLAQRAAEPSRTLDAAEALVELNRSGDLLPGWYDDWVLLERERLRQLRLHALEGLSARLAREGLFALALEAAMAAVCCEPLRESAHRAVVAAHLAEGNIGEARRYLRWARAYLQAELGVEPSRHWMAMTAELDRRVRPAVPAQRRAGPFVPVTPR